MKTNEILLIALTELREVAPALADSEYVEIGFRAYHPRYGICCNAQDYIRDLTETELEYDKACRALNGYMKQWPEACDAESYPVGGWQEYNKGLESRTLWQNPRRIELLNWLIKTLTEELENE